MLVHDFPEVDYFTEERQRLADAVKHHQSQQNSVPAQPEGEYYKQSPFRVIAQCESC